MRIIRFIKQVCAVAAGCMLALLGLLLITVFVLFQFWPSKLNYKIDNHTVVVLDLEGGQLVEATPPQSLLGHGSNKRMDVKLIKKAIREATTDSRIDAIYLKLSYLNAGWAVLEEVREDLLAFKKAGKSIVAYGDTYTNKSYYLASVADEIILNPSGILVFNGLSATVFFYTKFFENIFVKPTIVRAGTHKSWGEAFFLHKMSEESKQQTNAYLTCVYEHFLTNISLSRAISVSDLKLFAHNLSATLPKEALHKAMITKVDYEVEARKLLKEQICKAHGVANPSFIHHTYYASSKNQADAASKIAVVIAEGEIINGRTSMGYLGERDFVKTIKAVQEDPSIKAVVLRINSPGGSALAGDTMWKAIEDLKISKKVVASMSDVAASAGYLIAAPCHYIFAQPTTLTGSIGVFLPLFDPTQLMQKIGIEQDVVKTAPSADFFNPRLNYSEAELKWLHKMVQAWYDDFLRKVAQGRGLQLEQVEKLASGSSNGVEVGNLATVTQKATALEQVEKLASGRIYSAQAAQSNGLVDEVGNLDAAIQKAAALAGLTEKYRVHYLPRCKTKWERLWEELGGYIGIGNDRIAGKALLMNLVQEYPLFSHLLMMQQRHGLQAMLPYGIAIS